MILEKLFCGRYGETERRQKLKKKRTLEFFDRYQLKVMNEPGHCSGQ